MDSEIKKPELSAPKFFREPYDYRNIEKAGGYRGVGEAGKTASFADTSESAIPLQAHKMMVPRDHEG